MVVGWVWLGIGSLCCLKQQHDTGTEAGKKGFETLNCLSKAKHLVHLLMEHCVFHKLFISSS